MGRRESRWRWWRQRRFCAHGLHRDPREALPSCAALTRACATMIENAAARLAGRRAKSPASTGHPPANRPMSSFRFGAPDRPLGDGGGHRLPQRFARGRSSRVTIAPPCRKYAIQRIICSESSPVSLQSSGDFTMPDHRSTRVENLPNELACYGTSSNAG